MATHARSWLIGFPLLLVCLAACAGEVYVAVAANFADAARQIAAEFERDTGHRVRLSAGSSGKFYAQIKSGAPFEVFLSADVERPRRLEQEKLAVPGSRFTYAVGRLVLWSARVRPINADTLRAGGFSHLAIANPKIAPYGAAAFEVLERLALTATVRPRLVYGEDIGQTFQLAATGAADLAFVALSQVTSAHAEIADAYWLVPAGLHRPIEQQAVLLARGESNAAARAFLLFLQGPRARAALARFGYAAADERRP